MPHHREQNEVDIYIYNDIYVNINHREQMRTPFRKSTGHGSQMVTGHPCRQLLLLPGMNVFKYLKCNGSDLFWLNVRKEGAISQSPQLR